MARVTRHIRVSSRQRKGSALIVIESRRRPSFRVVAVLAKCIVVFGELPPMRIGVAILAILGRSSEYSFASARGNQMARTAGDGMMRAKQWKLRFSNDRILSRRSRTSRYGKPRSPAAYRWRRFRAMRSLNCPWCGSAWQAVQL